MPKINFRRCFVPILLLTLHTTASLLQASRMGIKENQAKERKERNGENIARYSHRFSNIDIHDDTYSRELDPIKHSRTIKIEVDTANTSRQEKYNSLWAISSPVKR